MSGNQRLCSAGRRLGGFAPGSYTIFDREEETKDIAIWQPGGAINDISNLPTPVPKMKDKAKEFLNTAKENGCHLAAAPEWAYDINWVTDHADHLFSEGSPLFVLGCAPIRESTRHDVIEALETEYDVHEDSDVECNPNEFLTPTIVPIKAASRHDSGNDAILVQYKNHPMSDGVLPNEQANLATGEFVWKIDPRDAPTVVVWTCSDIMDDDLRQDVEGYARQNDTFVVHVQCNPGPFNETWVDFRNQAFDGSDMKVTHVCANWGRVTFDGEIRQLGYSGIYTKADRRPPLDRYDTTYRKGGLVGTKPGYLCDYIWIMPNDVISRVQFNRPNPGTTGAGAASFSLPRILETWSWEPEADTYTTGTPGVAECDDPACDRWRSELPESPLARELIAAIGLGKIDFEQLPASELTPETDIRWAALETLKDTDGAERLGHVLATHPRRTNPSPGEEVELLVEGLDKASEENICLNNEFSLEDVPMNAEYEDKPVKVCLTVLSRPGDSSERKGAVRLNEWINRRNDKRFKPIVVTMDSTDGMVLKTLEGYEDVSLIDNNPERVSTTSKLVKVNP